MSGGEGKYNKKSKRGFCVRKTNKIKYKTKDKNPRLDVLEVVRRELSQRLGQGGVASLKGVLQRQEEQQALTPPTLGHRREGGRLLLEEAEFATGGKGKREEK